MWGALLAVALIEAAPVESALGVALRAQCPDPTSDEYFFPANSFPVRSRPGDSTERRWFTTFMRRSQQQSLSCGPARKRDVYRMIWIPSWVGIRAPGVREVVILAAREPVGGSLSISLVEHVFDGGVEAAPTRKSIARGDWAPLEARLRQVAWTDRDPGSAIDGAAVIFEAQRAGRYLVIHRSAGRLGEMRELTRAFVALAGVQPPAGL
jgi:hypothetical protein